MKSSAYSQKSRDDAQAELNKAQRDFDNACDIESAGIFAVEEENELLITNFEQILNRSATIDNPPSKISAKVCGQGTYKIYIWASQ